MRIDSLNIMNFKGFTDRTFLFNPEFNLIVGDNGTGKTSLLDALSIALGGWLLGIRGYDSRHIRPHEVRLEGFGGQTTDDDTEQHISINWEPQYPCVIEASGEVLGEMLSWSRALNTSSGRTTYIGARNIKELAGRTDAEVSSGKNVLLPLISYYGTGRLWNVPRETAQVKSEAAITEKTKVSRREAYRNSIDPRISVSDLVRWIARQSWITYQKGGKVPPIYVAVRDAVVSCLEGAQDMRFDAEYGEVFVLGDQVMQPFNNLSDGLRCMLAMVGDIARKAATLNPHLGPNVLTETPGVVLIDELDLHLHPTWQRHVIEDLRTTFPKIQFFAATHSPFLIQSLRSGEELSVLDGYSPAQLGDKPLEEIARAIMKVTNPQVSARYAEMKTVARHYLETLEEARNSPKEKLAAYKEELAKSISMYADNPAFQAFLEMKRAAKLGE